MEICREPFPHLIADNAFDDDLLAQAASTWPSSTWPDWTAVYDTVLERGKYTCTDWLRMPTGCQLLLGKMLALSINSLAFGDAPDDLVPDGSLWGGGMHSMASGGHLDLHEDSDRHISTGWERRFNAILFLNREWPEAWGGHLELWTSDLSACAKKILPAPGRLVIFQVGDKHYHGVPSPISCPVDVQRMSLATFWFKKPAPDQVFKRPRANFVGPAGQHEPIKDIVRRMRNKLVVDPMLRRQV